MHKVLVYLLLSFLPFACQVPSAELPDEQWPLREVASPASTQSGEPNLFVSEEGRVYLSWIDALENDEYALRFSVWEEEKWTTPQTIAQDSGWFVNWADFPSVVASGDHMAAHWLTKSGSGTFEYDVTIALSDNRGADWSTPFVLHQDSLQAEHGFVSMLPYQGKTFAVWLDGRNTKPKKEQGHEHHHEEGAMSLRTAIFDSEGKVEKREELDGRICDCCQTDAISIGENIYVVYRDRSQQEIRDIYIARYHQGRWSQPRPVHQDQWQIKGCPVNGPAICGRGSKIAVAWFTAARDTSKVQLAISTDGADSFSMPIRVDHGNPLGRVDVLMLNTEHLVLSWMERTDNGAEIRLAVFDKHHQLVADKRVAYTGYARANGFPVMEMDDEQIFFTWTQASEDKTQVKTAVLDIEEVIK